MVPAFRDGAAERGMLDGVREICRLLGGPVKDPAAVATAPAAAASADDQLTPEQQAVFDKWATVVMIVLIILCIVSGVVHAIRHPEDIGSGYSSGRRRRDDDDSGSSGSSDSFRGGGGSFGGGGATASW
jgi:uncharacterized membrane protein YgcG